MKNSKTIKIWGLLTNDVYVPKDTPQHLSEITLDLEDFEKLIQNRIESLGIELPTCKKCGKKIFYLNTKNNKQMPITCGLISHFADCPNANYFRK